MSKDSKVKNDKILYKSLDGLTEFENKFKKVSLPYLQLIMLNSKPYDGFGEVANIAFQMVMGGVWYNGQSQEKSKHAIIHSKKPLTIREILLESRPSDFMGLNDEQIEIMIGNFLYHKWNPYFKLNVFLEWKYWNLRMVFMQRHPALMRTLNPNAVITPGQIIKVIANSAIIFNDMERAITLRTDRILDKMKMHQSFVNFIESLIGQMDEHVRDKVPLYSHFVSHSNMTSLEYLQELYNILSEMHPAEGLVVDEKDLMERLPKSCIVEYNRIKEEEKHMPQTLISQLDNMDGMEIEEDMSAKQEVMANMKKVERDIIARKPNVVTMRHKGRRGRPKKCESLVIQTNISIPAQAKRFANSPDPMDNITEFIKYFRSKVSSRLKWHVVFCDFGCETNDAGIVMDTLKLNKRDKVFLDAWITGYVADNLRVKEDALNISKTSIKTFKGTFEVYNNSYYEHK